MKFYPLLFVAGILSFLFLTGKVSIVSIPGPHRASADPAVKLQEVKALGDAANRSDTVRTSQDIFVLLDTAQRVGGPGGAALIREHLPSLAARYEADVPELHRQLSAVDLKTSYGRKCRTAFLRMYEQEGWYVYTLAHDVARSRSTWPVVRRFRARWRKHIRDQGLICRFTV